jgi:7-keto-8-aminopelargonate synthetase-like enzyme
MDLLQKHAHLLERVNFVKQIVGSDDPVTCVDKVLSPTHAIINGRETILAGTNNYMGITFDPSCIQAGKDALDAFGTGTTGSRIANGTYAMHRQLEEDLARFLKRKHAMVFTTGFQANLGMIAALAGPNDTVYLDADSHASIYDGCTLSGAKLVRFRHNDPENLARRLARANDEGEGGRLVILEGIYSMFGDRPPLDEFVDVKREYGYTLMMDEAHSIGILGENGRGLAEEAGLEDEVDFVVGTFSKSIGAIGGFGAGDHPMFDIIRYATRAYMFTASPSPSTIATATEALRQLEKRPELRERLRYNSQRLHDGFRELGLELCCDVVSPVVAVRVKDEPSTVAMWHALLREGVYVNLALPPGTPNAACLLRCSVSAAHSDEDIDRIIELFANVVAQREGQAAE